MSYRPPETPRSLLVAEALGALTEAETKHAPPALDLAGDLDLLRAPLRVAIVGSRRASDLGVRRAHRLAKELASSGAVVVSGLAEGIDRAAHEGAIRNGGRTIAVIGTPLDRCYPAKHARLQEEIYTDHLLVSQFSPGHRTFPSDFVKRNRTMALLSHVSVIVEASDGSGSLSQAAETQRLGHPLFFMESVLSNKDLEWPERFQRHGARVLADTSEILELVDAV